MSEPETWKLPDGTEVKLAYRPRPTAFAFSASIKWVDIPDIPESKWREFDFRKSKRYPLKIRDQNGRGACTYFSLTGALMCARYVAGYPHIDLCPWFGYANAVDGNDVGSSISESIEFASDIGLCRTGLVPYASIRKRDIPPDAYENAKRYRVEYTLAKHPAKDGDNGFRSMCVAAQLGYPSLFSLAVAGDFNNLDDDLAPRNVPGQHNHAVWGGFAMSRSRRTGEWLLGTENSWTTSWGSRGYFNTAKRTIRGTFRDSASIVAVRVLPDENPPPAVL